MTDIRPAAVTTARPSSRLSTLLAKQQGRFFEEQRISLATHSISVALELSAFRCEAGSF
jgi:hypothetical protein